ncbi:hypothetical protein T440DRAFT_388382 [Plenodomus tracheiphilus IPT5]|uniref:CRIB domain-containing protein n=1 Tax=Plenodomus tracheiphilus IPT5 TaxID=1408161 RepID=A0A6A7BFV8_9PLEO|nr:hypothetical protein T440DRAFT_388382 [Plenodomus tracheiphilus IPT5]
MAEHEGSWHGTPLARLQSGGQTQNETIKAGARRSFFRGRKGKRNSETTGAIVPDFAEMDFSERRASMLRKDKKRFDYADESPPPLINQISKPFDFQHVSHTDRHQFAALEKASIEDISSGFQAVRASRPPSRGLTGTRADDLHFRDFSSENLTSVDHRSTSALGLRSQLHSPGVQHQWQQSEVIPQFTTARPNLRLARSMESFSQPGVSPRKHYEPLVLASPPRSSARQPPPQVRSESDCWQDEEITAARRSSRSKRESGVWDSFVLPGVSTPDQLSGIQEDSYFGHALTTPDDSAIHAMTPPFSPSLADVAEEPERFISPRPAPQPPGRTPTTPKSPYFESFSFSNHRSSVARARSDSQSQTSPHAPSPRCSLTRPSSQMSDTLGSSGLTRRISVRQAASNRSRSNTWRAIEESWEDDVDYIYENALEADCDNAWDYAYEDDLAQDNRADVSGYSIDQARHTLASNDTSGEPLAGDLFSGSFRTSLLVPSTSSLPDLAPASAISHSTTSTGLPTPSESFSTNRFGTEEGFVLTPSLLVPQEYKEAGEITYEDLLDEYNGSDRHYPMIDASQSVNSSTRSSRVRFSRRSSYDSSMMSSVQGSGLWSSPIRRSASSAGSVPELVPSRRSRRDLGFSLVIDKLSEQVGALADCDQTNANDDLTPPGRALEGQTFFTTEDETHSEIDTGSIASELKESLELAQRGSQLRTSTVTEDELRVSLDQARQGPQRSERSPMRQHKPALSDSAAKLLSGIPGAIQESKGKARKRAATTTQAQQPMLSLFPTPPRYSNRS